MANVKVTMEGDKALRKRLENAAKGEVPRKEMRRVLNVVGERILAIVQSRTPVKTGRTLRSERVRVMVSPKKEDIRISIVAGGPDAPHARVVHEIHKTKSKFLEGPVLEAVPTVGGEIAQELDLGAMVPPA